MSDIWFPGRTPLCCRELLEDLSQIGESICLLLQTKDSCHLEVIEALINNCLLLIDTESNDCLSSDATLNNLRTFFEEVAKASMVFYKNNAWQTLRELATCVFAVRGELAEALIKTTSQENIHARCTQASDRCVQTHAETA